MEEHEEVLQVAVQQKMEDLEADYEDKKRQLEEQYQNSDDGRLRELELENEQLRRDIEGSLSAGPRAARLQQLVDVFALFDIDSSGVLEASEIKQLGTAIWTHGGKEVRNSRKSDIAPLHHLNLPVSIVKKQARV